MTTVDVVIPHVPIPERRETLKRAIASVSAQTYPVNLIHVAVDHSHEGPAKTRTRGLFASVADYVIYLDDDDWLEPNCIERLVASATETNADVTYPWFFVSNGDDPFPVFFGQPWDDEKPHIFPVTYLVNRELAQRAGGFPDQSQLGSAWAPEWNGSEGSEDWHAILALIDADAKIVHLPERLWHWEHGGSHFSGRVW